MKHNELVKMDVSSQEAIAEGVLKEIFCRRRLPPGKQDKPVDFISDAAPHLPRLMESIANGSPIEMVLPAFPAKSPNRRKTLGPLPDHGEDLAFANLNYLCERIADIYSPGARITVCSDGRVFADLVRSR